MLRGEIPDPTRIPGGCRFHPRCPQLRRRLGGSGRGGGTSAGTTALAVLPADGEHRVACHLDAVSPQRVRGR